MNTYRSIFILLLSSIFSTSIAQNRDVQSYIEQSRYEFSQYKKNAQSEYSAFLEKRNAEFAEFLSRDWQHYQTKAGEDIPKKPYPDDPVIAPDKQPDIASVEIPIKKVVEIPEIKPIAPQFKLAIKTNSEPKKEVKPSVPTPAPTPTPRSGLKFIFAGSQLSVGLTSEHKFTMSDVKEKSVSKVWRDLSKSSIYTVVEECQLWKESLRLNDYLYVLMLDEMCTSFFGESKHNEARLLKTYILTQSGYDAKCARTSSGLVMLLAIEEQIYQKSYLTINGVQYYIIDEPKDGNKQYYTFSQKFSEQSKSCSMRIVEEFVVNKSTTPAKTLTSKRYPSLTISASVDKNLMKMYDNYPKCKWDVYAKAPMSSQLSAKIIPVLKSEIAGKSDIEAANMILNFVQTAFEYKNDLEYFGYERSLFVDETFYYPYCDCEDRSILYANLMQNLLGLDVVLMYYPNHLATAVKFNSECKGDYIVVENKKYIICDPTYIGANVGVAMPQYKNIAADIVVL